MKIGIEEVVAKLATGQMTDGELKEWLSRDSNRDVACGYLYHMVERINESLSENLLSQLKAWLEYRVWDERGGQKLSPVGAELMQQLAAERRELEASAAAVFKIR